MSEISCSFFISLIVFVAVVVNHHRCPPCKAIKPLYEELSDKYGDVAFGKIDVDENSEAAAEFNISAVPTFIFFDGEEQIERFSGADPNQLESLIKDLDGR